MSTFTKQVLIKNLTIFSADGEIEAVLGDNITTVMNIDYFENIFHPNFEFVIKFASVDNPLSDLQLRGTETVSIEIKHPSIEESFEFAQVQSGTRSAFVGKKAGQLRPLMQIQRYL